MITDYEWDIIEKKLSMGLDVICHDVLIKNHTIRKLEEMGSQDFLNNTSISIREIDDFMGRGFKKNNPEFDLLDLCLVDKRIEDVYLSFLNTITGWDWTLLKFDGFYVFVCLENKVKLDKEKTKDVILVFNKMYCRNRYDPYEKYGNYDMADDETKAVIDKLIMDELSNYTKPKITITSMAEGVAYSKYSNLSIFNVWDLTIYQLNSAVKNIVSQSEQEIMQHVISSGCADKNFKYNQMLAFERK